jgi:outer membrane lipoprotein-sorting protein
MIKILSILATLFLIYIIQTPATLALDAGNLVVDSFNYMRGKASIATVEMVIHRPDWERRMTIKAWTKGERESLFFITAPPKDNGNGTLKKGREMWIFNPKVNRVIKLPPSMMSQAWMGSDFSNNDLAKSDSLIYDYRHRLIETESVAGKKIYHIESLPKPDAPVVWGMLKLKIREDLILLSETFYDEDLKPVKVMTTLEINLLGGKLYPKVWKMQKADTKNEYTLLNYKALSFKSSLPDRLFSVSNLKNPRR